MTLPRKCLQWLKENKIDGQAMRRISSSSNKVSSTRTSGNQRCLLCGWKRSCQVVPGRILWSGQSAYLTMSSTFTLILPLTFSNISLQIENLWTITPATSLRGRSASMATIPHTQWILRSWTPTLTPIQNI